MNIVGISRTTIDGIEDIPEIVYKYRDWGNELHKTIITDRKVYFAEPTSFEDPLDCKIEVDYESMTDKEIHDFYVMIYEREYPYRDGKKRRTWVREQIRKKLLRNLKYLKTWKEMFFEEYNSRIGVLSLTSNPDRMEMWEKYANGGKGFVVGFNSRIMFELFYSGAKVQYYDELPKIYPYPKHNYIEQYYYQVFSKLRKWEFEEEYRTLIFDMDKLFDRVRVVPPEAYNCIILGKNMPEEWEEAILNSIPNELEHIRIISSNEY